MKLSHTEKIVNSILKEFWVLHSCYYDNICHNGKELLKGKTNFINRPLVTNVLNRVTSQPMELKVMLFLFADAGDEIEIYTEYHSRLKIPMKDWNTFNYLALVASNSLENRKTCASYAIVAVPLLSDYDLEASRDILIDQFIKEGLHSRYLYETRALYVSLLNHMKEESDNEPT